MRRVRLPDLTGSTKTTSLSNKSWHHANNDLCVSNRSRQKWRKKLPIEISKSTNTTRNSTPLRKARTSDTFHVRWRRIWRLRWHPAPLNPGLASTFGTQILSNACVKRRVKQHGLILKRFLLGSFSAPIEVPSKVHTFPPGFASRSLHD